MKHKAVIELWDDGTYSIFVQNLREHNLNAQGKSVKEAKTNLFSAVEDYVSMYKELNKPIPKEIDNPTFEYKYDVASFFDYFDWINVSKFAKKAGINPSLMRQYKKGIIFASDKQGAKIQDAINKLGKELASVEL